MIRAPDTYVYPAPFNLVEAIFVAPLELVYQYSLTQPLTNVIQVIYELIKLC